MFLNRHACLFLLSLTTKLLFAQDFHGISFQDIDLTTALTQAQREDKIVFIYFCHSLSTPCHDIQSVLNDSLVGDYYNRHFINLSMDAETTEGSAVSDSFKIYAFPTYLFIDQEGLLLHRSQGVYHADQLISLAAEARDPDNRIKDLRLSYDSGDRSEQPMYHYAAALFLNNDPLAKEIAKEYLDSFPSWTTRNRMEMVLRVVEQYDDRYYQFIVSKRYLFIKEFGEGIVDSRLTQLIEGHFNEMGEDVDLSEVKKIYEEVFPTSKSVPLYDYYEMNYLERIGKTEQYIEKAKAYIKKYPFLSWSALNELAWAFYEKVEDESALRMAVKWARKSIGLNDNHYNNDTLAALYFKLGNQKKATKFAEKAIALAKAAGEDPSETEGLLEKINRM